MAKYSLGWLPDLPDARDYLYAAPLKVLQKLPVSADLRSKCPPVYDQGDLGSCTANALAGAFQFGQKKQKLPAFMPSRLFIYYNERVILNTVNSDSGAQIRDGIKTLNKQGVCPETTWPYNTKTFTNKPLPEAYKEALKNEITSYQRLTNTLTILKGCLAEGYPFVFGFTVYESFMTPQVAKTGIMPMPAAAEKSVGGHAVMGAGYDDARQAFIIRNSWGPDWGLKGYFYMPYAYITDSSRCDDFWTIRQVE